MKERTVRDLSGEIWAELHAVIDARRDRGDHVFGSVDCRAVDATIDIVATVLARNAGKTIVNDEADSSTLMMSLYSEDRMRRRRQSARRMGVTLQ